MANLYILDGNGTGKYVKMAGAGSDADPFVPDQTIALPTGAATSAAQTTGNASLATLAGAVSGTEMQVDVASVTLPTALYHGQTTVTTAGTEVALSTSQAILSGVTVKALAANTGIIYVGANPVTSSTGFALAAGEQIFIEIANLATVYIDASADAQGVSWIAT